MGAGSSTSEVPGKRISLFSISILSRIFIVPGNGLGRNGALVQLRTPAISAFLTDLLKEHSKRHTSRFLQNLDSTNSRSLAIVIRVQLFEGGRSTSNSQSGNSHVIIKLGKQRRSSLITTLQLCRSARTSIALYEYMSK